MPKITQAELEAVLQSQEVAEELAYAIRKRIEAGDEVESGKLQAESRDSEEPTQCSTTSLCGLLIERTEPAEIPDWIDYIPNFDEEPMLSLSVVGEKDITMTSEEFIKMRRFLAKMRGYAVPEEAQNV